MSTTTTTPTTTNNNNNDGENAVQPPTSNPPPVEDPPAEDPPIEPASADPHSIPAFLLPAELGVRSRRHRVVLGRAVGHIEEAKALLQSIIAETVPPSEEIVDRIHTRLMLVGRALVELDSYIRRHPRTSIVTGVEELRYEHTMFMRVIRGDLSPCKFVLPVMIIKSLITDIMNRNSSCSSLLLGVWAKDGIDGVVLGADGLFWRNTAFCFEDNFRWRAHHFHIVGVCSFK